MRVAAHKVVLSSLASSLTGQVAAVLSPVKVEENTLVRPSGESYSFLGIVMPT